MYPCMLSGCSLLQKYSSGVLSLGAHDGTATDSAASYTRSMMAGKCLGLLCRHRWPPSVWMLLLLLIFAAR